MTPEERRSLKRRREMRQAARLTMGEMATIRHALIVQRDALDEALRPPAFVYQVWSDARRPIEAALDAITEARCALKRRQYPDFNPAGDSECEGLATDAEIDAWAAAHPDPEPEPIAEVVERSVDHGAVA